MVDLMQTLVGRTRSDTGMQKSSRRDSVPESRFGFWFLGTDLWEKHVIQITLDDLVTLMSTPRDNYPVVLDAGCGQGKAFRRLQALFNPERLIGVDLDARGLMRARNVAVRQGIAAELLRADCACLALPDRCVDLLLCHQTFHHLVHQEQALAEFFRVLKPGGVLLFAESTREYIYSWAIRILFRHPMEVQRSEREYLDMLGRAGFVFERGNILLPYRWWSRTTLTGLMELLRLRPVPPPGRRRETLLYMVASKPPAQPGQTWVHPPALAPLGCAGSLTSGD